mgnify:CR=1 FL=1
MVTVFVVVAWLLALGSWFFVTGVTAGVAILCFACFMVMAARVAQADLQHKELLARLSPPTNAAATS